MSAAGRLAARRRPRPAVVAEFTRRREAQLADATARKVPRGCRDGEFPDAELGMELVTSSRAAQDMMDMALDLPARLPRTWAALGAGLIDGYRARLIWKPTQHLTDADAAHADEILAALAPGLRYDQLARKATALAMKLDPEAFKRGKERPAPTGSGWRRGGKNLATRSCPAVNWPSKTRPRPRRTSTRSPSRCAAAGCPAPCGSLRVLAFNDLTQGRDPLATASPAPAGRDSRRAGQGGSGSPRGGPAVPRRRTPDTRRAPR